MRLINSNKFKEKLNYLNYELYNSHSVGELSKEEKDTVSLYIQHISKMVDNMPTENAIPIKWFESKQTSGKLSFADCAAIEDLLNEWKKENE